MQLAKMSRKILTISGLKEIYQEYDFFIFDQWGVMHDGNNSYRKAIDCIYKLNSKKKKISIISNSSKRKYSTLLNLSKLGFNPAYFHEVLTSGEMIWQSLINKDHDLIKNLGKRYFHIHNEEKKDSKLFLEGLDKYTEVTKINDADFILGCTPFAKNKVIDYFPILDVAIKKNLTFICVNPDFDTYDNFSKKLSFCMGTISALYENMGGEVFTLGKPNVEIYYETIKKIINIDKSKILAIGDSIHHDIQGAKNFGIDSLLITSTGIHQDFFDKKNPLWESDRNSLRKFDINPTFISADLRF